MPSAGGVPPAATAAPALPGQEVFFADTWYPLLCGFAAFNVVLLVATIFLPDSQMVSAAKINRRVQLALAVPHIVGFGLLTFMPIRTWHRSVWHKWTNVLVMRLLGCVAEVSWMTQLALALVYFEQKLLHAWAGMYRSVIVSQIMLAAICVGEFLLVTGEVTRDSLWFIIGEGLRALGFLILIPPCIKLLCAICKGARDPQLPHVVQDSHVAALQGCCTLRVFIFALMSYCLGYVSWAVLWAMRHYSAYYDQQIWAKSEETLGIADGLRDVLTTRNLTRDWHDWRPTVLWMALYFNLTSWASLMLVWPTVTKASRASAHDVVDKEAGDLDGVEPVKDVDGDLEERKLLEQPLIAEDWKQLADDGHQAVTTSPLMVEEKPLAPQEALDEPPIAEDRKPPADEGHQAVTTVEKEPLALAHVDTAPDVEEPTPVLPEEAAPGAATEDLPHRGSSDFEPQPAAPQEPEPPAPRPTAPATPETPTRDHELAATSPQEPAPVAPEEPEVPPEPTPPERPAPVALPSPFAPAADVTSRQSPGFASSPAVRPQFPPVYFDPNAPFASMERSPPPRPGPGRTLQPDGPDIPAWASRLYYNNPVEGLPAAGSPAARSPRFGNRQYN